MDKLISMIDFVLEQDLPQPIGRTAGQMVKYGLFLKQKLELWMFVPCKLVNGVWVVLEEPNIINDHNGSFFKMQTDFHIEKEYEEAKGRVLFEGFELGKFVSLPKTQSVRNEELKRTIFVCNSISIEDLTRYNLELTPTAQKQIGL